MVMVRLVLAPALGLVLTRFIATKRDARRPSIASLTLQTRLTAEPSGAKSPQGHGCVSSVKVKTARKQLFCGSPLFISDALRFTLAAHCATLRGGQLSLRSS